MATRVVKPVNKSAIHGSIFFLLGLFAASAAQDPRIELVQLQMDLDPTAAIKRIDEHYELAPKAAGTLGLSYLKGTLLQGEGHRGASLKAFSKTLAETPPLAPWARYQLALAQEADGHPAVAAGMLATLLGSQPPKSLIEPSVELLRRSLSIDGDCRVLNGLLSLRLEGLDRRRMLLTRAACARRAGKLDQEKNLLIELLAEDTTDDPAHLAADSLSARIDLSTAETRTLIHLGMAYFHHRQFDLSADLLGRALSKPGSKADSPPRQMTELAAFENRYSLARSFFWLGQYDRAAAVFAEVAKAVTKKNLKAKALYQQARCFELAGSLSSPPQPTAELTDETIQAWGRAVELLEQVWIADPNSGWASAAKIGCLRLQWLLGQAKAAQQTLRLLERKGSADNLARALLFLAVSDLVAGRGDRATDFLASARKTGRLPQRELAYWSGRLAEIDGRPRDAVEAYLEVLSQDPIHPFGEAAQARLNSSSLQAQALEVAEWLAAGPEMESLYKAWLLFGDTDPRGVTAHRGLMQELTKNPKAAAFINMSVLPTPDWPLWKDRLDTPEQLFMALGLFGEAPTPVLRYFPIADPSLAFTGSTLLASNGATQRSLYIAEVLLKRIPKELPANLLSQEYQELLYPFRYSYLIMREASKREIDPFLLAGLIREESRFDADAFSGASARGLTQFVYPTAREIAESIEMDPITPQDIHRPEVAITLGAAYLRHLSDALGGNLESMVAAYNAGEPQALLWKRYCYSDEPEEFWSKVAFRETRRYVRKVLTSRSHYRVLYGKSNAFAGSSSQPVPVVTTPPPSASDASGGDAAW